MKHSILVALILLVLAPAIGFADPAPISVVPTVDPAHPGPLAAQPWLREGLRITYQMHAAEIPGDPDTFRTDPNGNFIGPDGTRYDLHQSNGNAGVGYQQFTVSQLSKDKVVISIATLSLNIQKLDAPPTLGGFSGFSGNPVDDKPGDLWMTPATLNQYLTVARAPGVTAKHMPWKVGDHTFDAVAIESHAKDYYSAQFFDLATGLLIHSTVSSHSNSPLVSGKGGPAHGDQFLNIMDIASIRDVKTPWANETMVDWPGKTKILHCTQTYNIHMPGMMGPPTPINYPNQISILASGDGWVEGDEAITVNRMMPPTKSKISWGHCQYFAVFAGPAGLASLQKGQALDEDPITQMKTTVSNVDDRFVVISQANVNSQFDMQYDKHTGMMVTRHRIDSNPFNHEMKTEVTTTVESVE